MPTIRQLPVASSVSASDVLPVSQGGTTRSLSIGNLLSSTQPAIALVPGKLLGRASATSGGPEPVSVGSGLAVASGVITATAQDHTVLPVVAALSSGDEVVVNSGGAARRMPATALRGLFAAGSGVSIDSVGTITAGGASAPATQGTIGGVKPGTGLVVSSDGTLSSDVAYLNGVVSAQAFAAGDLRRFGWVADGRDQTAVFRAALAAISSVGGEIIIPASDSGTTLGAITIDRPVTIRGSGGPAGQTTLRPLTPTTTMFTVTAPFVSFDNLAISPINPSISKQTAGAYIQVEASAARFRASRLTLTEFYEGVLINGNVPSVELLSLRGFLYSQGLSQSPSFLHFRGGLDVRVDNLTVNGPTGDQVNAKSGIWVENVGDLLLTNSDIIAMGVTLLVNPGPGQGVTSLWVSDTFLDSAYRGAEIVPAGGLVTRCRLSNVWASSHQTQGMVIGTGIDGLDIDNPHVFLNTTDGIVLRGGTNVRIRGGQIAQNGGNGVLVSPGVSKWSVTGVAIGATGGLTANTGYGVSISAGASDNYRVEGNAFLGNAGGAVLDGGTGTNKGVWNNLGDPTGYTVFRDGTTGQLVFSGQQSGSGGYTFRASNGTELMRVGPGGNLVVAGRITDATGLLASLTPASGTVLGGIKQGSGVLTAADGTLSVTASAGVGSFNGRTGAVSLGASDVSGALAYTPYDSGNPAGYQTAAQVTATLSGGVSANVSGVIGVANGGTGATSAAAARTALGLAVVASTGAVADTTGTLALARGGTGATTAVAARGALGLAAVAASGAYVDLSGTPAAYTLPTASSSVLGGVKVDGSSVVISGAGVISAAGSTAFLPVTTTYTASGAIATSDLLAVVSSASQCDMTLAGGTTNGQRITIKRSGAGVVTITLNLDGAAGAVITANSSTVKEAVSLIWNATTATWMAV